MKIVCFISNPCELLSFYLHMSTQFERDVGPQRNYKDPIQIL